MRLYLIAPVIPESADEGSIDTRLRACVDPIAEFILELLAEDPALFAVRHNNESSGSTLSPTRIFGYANAAEIPDSEALRQVLRESLDPFSGKWSHIRSLVTCRAVNFGYDGQALVCLPTDVTEVQSPDSNLISVEDISGRLLETDRMDGLLNN